MSEYVCKGTISLRSLPGNVYLNRGEVKVCGYKDHWTKENGFISNGKAYINKAALTNFLGYPPKLNITPEINPSEEFFFVRCSGFYLSYNMIFLTSATEVSIDGTDFICLSSRIPIENVFYKYMERESYVNNSYITKNDNGTLNYYVPSSPTSRGDKKLLPNPIDTDWIKRKIHNLIVYGHPIRKNRHAVCLNHFHEREQLGVLKLHDMASLYRYIGYPHGRTCQTRQPLRQNINASGKSILSSKGHKWKARGAKLEVWRKRNLAIYEESEKVRVWVHTKKPNDYVRFM